MIQLLEVETFLQQAMAPVHLNGSEKKSIPALLWSLSRAAPHTSAVRPKARDGPLHMHHAAFVYLGQGRQLEALELTARFNISLHPESETRYRGTDLEPVWSSLVAKAQKRQMPVYVDLDGNLSGETITESIAMATVSSLADRKNALGDDFADTEHFFLWLTTRVQSYYDRLDPWMAVNNPEIHHKAMEVKRKLTPMRPTLPSTSPPHKSSRSRSSREALHERPGICFATPLTRDSRCNNRAGRRMS